MVDGTEALLFQNGLLFLGGISFHGIFVLQVRWELISSVIPEATVEDVKRLNRPMVRWGCCRFMYFYGDWCVNLYFFGLCLFLRIPPGYFRYRILEATSAAGPFFGGAICHLECKHLCHLGLRLRPFELWRRPGLVESHRPPTQELSLPPSALEIQLESLGGAL